MPVDKLLPIATWLAGLFLGGAALLMLAFSISSIFEKERRAAAVSGVMAALVGILTAVFTVAAIRGVFAVAPWPGVLTGFAVLAIIAATALTVRTPGNPDTVSGAAGMVRGKVARLNEGDTVFSRLKESWARPYHARHSGRELEDTERVPPEFLNTLKDGELSGSSLPAKGIIDRGRGEAVVAMAEACAKVTFALERDELLNPKVADMRIEMTPEEAARRIKGFARQLGAVLCGVTKVDRRWIYSHRGVGGVARNAWGEAVEVDYSHAIVFAVEMDLALTNPGPHSPCVLETMQNYAKAAFIAAQLADFIARLGYGAKANQMEHYDGLLVPMAVDAGLGELSRMGYLVTREYGPRVRLNAVFTELELEPDTPVDLGMVDFCNVCRKCSHCCPSQSIPLDGRREHNGSLRWKLDADSCLKYWQSVGTDCAVCMRVCPWSHARTWPHRLVTELVSRNWIARRVFTWMDDVFYGRKPRPKVPPQWAGCGMEKERE